MMRFASYLLVTASASLSVALPSRLPSQGFDWDSIQYLLAFGDSYTYVQGTAGHQNYSFIGDRFNLEYNAQTLLNNKIVQNQTATAEGGPNWVEYLTGCGLEEGSTSPLDCRRQLWDFAFAGADISEEHTPLHHNFTVSLVSQIEQYKSYGHPVLKNRVKPSKALVAIWIGINDLNDSAKYAVHFPTFYNELMDTLFASVRVLYSLGYRSYLFMNLPPLDRTPGNQKKVSPSPNATQVMWYNEALAQHAESFDKQYPDTNVLLFDAHSVLNAMMDQPARYGISNTTNFCPGYDQPDINWNYQAYGCPTPLDTYFWFNSGHLTSYVHKLLARALERTLK